MLDKLKEMTGGDEARIKVYVATFLEEMLVYCAILQKAIEENDIERIQYTAHISKPLTSLMGFEDLHEEANNLEIEIKENKINGQLNEKAEHLLQRMKESVEIMKAYS